MLAAFDKGGIEKVTLDIVNNLNPMKYDITVYTIWYGGHCQSLVNQNVKVKPFFFKRYVKGVVRLVEYLPPRLLYKLFVRGKYDVEIAAGDGECSKIISGSPNKNSKKISWIHMDVIEQGSRLEEFQNNKSSKKIYCQFDRIICVSKQAEKQFNNKFGFADKTCTVHNPFLVDSILEASEEETDIHFISDVFNIVSVGRITKVKGYDRLIRCCKRLEKEDKLFFHLYIVGDGDLREEIENYINTNEITTVTILGFKSNPYPYIKCADLFVCSSYNEAYPLAIGESFILETPVIATKCSGSLEWMGEDKSGYIVNNNEESLYMGLKKVISNKELYIRLKEQATIKKQKIDKETIGKWELEFIGDNI